MTHPALQDFIRVGDTLVNLRNVVGVVRGEDQSVTLEFAAYDSEACMAFHHVYTGAAAVGLRQFFEQVYALPLPEVAPVAASVAPDDEWEKDEIPF